MSNSKYHSVYAGQRWTTAKGFYKAYRMLFDGGLCEKCKKAKAMEVHHIIPIDEDTINDDEIVYGLRNLIFLCRTCHRKIHIERDNNV